MSLSDLKRRSALRSDLHKPQLSGLRRGDLSALIVTGSLSSKPRPSVHSLLALTHKVKQPIQQTLQIQRLQEMRMSASKIDDIVVRGTAKSLKPVPMKKTWKLESGALSLSVTTVEPFIEPVEHSSAATSPAPCLPALRPTKSSGSMRLLPPLGKPSETRSISPGQLSESVEVWPYSKRISLQQRDDMLRQNLVILVFDGLVGDALRLEVWDRRPPVLHLRLGAARAIARLAARFQVVLFIQKNVVKAKRLLAYFLRAGVVFDGVYRSRNSWKTRPRASEASLPTAMLKYVQCYDQVYKDFGISESSRLVLVVSSLKLCEEEAADLSGSQLLYKQVSDVRHEVYVTGVPVGEEAPVTVLFSDPLCRETQTGATFGEITDCLLSFAEMLPMSKDKTVNWQDLYWILQTCPSQCKAEVVSTSFFQEEILLKQLPVAPKHVRSFSTDKYFAIGTCICESDNCLASRRKSCRSLKRFFGLQLLGKNPRLSKNVFIIPEMKPSARYEIVERDTEVTLFLEKKAERERRPSKRVPLVDI